MKAKQKTLLVLAILLVLAGAGYALLTRANAEAADSTSAAATVVTQFEASSLESISYTYEGEAVALTKVNDTWQLADDRSYHVNQTTVNSMVTALSDLTANRAITDVSDYSAYGTQSAALTVTAVVGGEEKVYQFGATNSVTGDVYLQMAGDATVYTVAAAKEACFDYGKAALYDTAYTPVTIAAGDITGITYHFEDSTENFTVALEAVSELADSSAADASDSASDSGASYQTVWYLQGSGDTLRQNAVTSMITAITAAPTAQNTNPGDLAQYGLASPLLTVQLTAADGTSQTFSLGIGTDGYYLMQQGDDSVYTVTIDMLNAFSVTGDELKLAGASSDSSAVDGDAAFSTSLAAAG
jgi:hypothetical protein